MKNYYQILGLDKNASQEDIKKAYRLYAKKFHPDTQGGDDFFEERFKEIKEAYHILSDESKRKEYDDQFYGTSTSSQNSNKTPREQSPYRNASRENILFSGYTLQVTDTFIEIFNKNEKILFNEIISMKIDILLTVFWIIVRILLAVLILSLFFIGEILFAGILCLLFLFNAFRMNMCILYIQLNRGRTVSIITWNSEAEQAIKVFNSSVKK